MSKHKKIRRLRRIIVFTSAFVLMIWVPILRYYVSTPWINACVLEYVDNMEESDYKWNMYNIDWLRHIEADNSNLNDSLQEYKIWEANWCIMSSDNLFTDLNNTFYCTITYIIKNLPVKEKYKEPLEIMKSE